MAPGGGTAQVALWVPTVVLAHVLALGVLVHTLLVANPRLRHALRARLAGCGARRHRGLPDAVCAAPAAGGPVPAHAASDASSGDAASGGDAASSGDAASGGSGSGKPPASVGGLVLVVAEACGGSDDGSGSGAPPAAPAGPAALRWEGLGLSVKGGPSGTKWVLRDAWGEAAGGEMQALLGPSGAGKSSLLEVLAGRRRAAAGRVLVARRSGGGGGGGSRGSGSVGLVPQEDAFPPTLTVLEVVRFYAALLPAGGGGGGGSGGGSGSGGRAAEVLRVMGLTAAADTLVRPGRSWVEGGGASRGARWAGSRDRGSQLEARLTAAAPFSPLSPLQVGGTLPGGMALRGLSGGERKRLAIACGVLAQPEVHAGSLVAVSIALGRGAPRCTPTAAAGSTLA
jgi:ABC-type nitrate/sulfonate/bicarbonate transport system ATPase subunit